MVFAVWVLEMERFPVQTPLYGVIAIGLIVPVLSVKKTVPPKLVTVFW